MWRTSEWKTKSEEKKRDKNNNNDDEKRVSRSNTYYSINRRDSLTHYVYFIYVYKYISNHRVWYAKCELSWLLFGFRSFIHSFVYLVCFVGVQWHLSVDRMMMILLLATKLFIIMERTQAHTHIIIITDHVSLLFDKICFNIIFIPNSFIFASLL